MTNEIENANHEVEKSDFVVYPNPDGTLPCFVRVIVCVIAVRNGCIYIKDIVCRIPSYLRHCYGGIKSDFHKTVEVKIQKVMPL